MNAETGLLVVSVETWYPPPPQTPPGVTTRRVRAEIATWAYARATEMHTSQLRTASLKRTVYFVDYRRVEGSLYDAALMGGDARYTIVRPPLQPFELERMPRRSQSLIPDAAGTTSLLRGIDIVYGTALSHAYAVVEGNDSEAGIVAAMRLLAAQAPLEYARWSALRAHR